jgi:ATP-dependent DNA helicase RecG
LAGETLLKSNIGTLKGVGKVRVELFRKLGIDTVEDLLYHFPRRYEDRGNIMKIAEIVPEESCSVLGTVTYPLPGGY